MPQDLRSYLDVLAGDSPDELYQVSTEVGPNLELTGVIATLDEQNRYPAVLFNRVRGPESAGLTSGHGARNRLARALNTSLDGMVEEYARREAAPRPIRYLEAFQRSSIPSAERIAAGV